MRTEGLTVDKLAGLSGGQSKQEITLDEMFGWYLNITFAVLFVFMIASFLFKTELIARVQKAEDEKGFSDKKFEDIEKTKEGQQYVKREKALIDLQRQELLNALDYVDAEDRKAFGLSVFSSIQEDGKVHFNITEIISGDTVFNNMHIKKNFIGGSQIAKKMLPYLSNMQTDWTKRVLEKAKKRLLGKGVKPVPIANNTEVLEKTNHAWLIEEISKRTGTLHNDYCEFQAVVLTHLYMYYFQNPKLLDGTEIAGLLNRYFLAEPEIKNSLLREIEEKLYQHAKKTLEDQGVMILSGASE